MANNIYIGNRYVPIFANPVEWDNLREYEPLTIVTYNGTAYTSKKTVPVGTALSNTEYWVVTGNYNAQVEEYRQATRELQTEVDGLETTVSGHTTSINNLNRLLNKRYVIIGDSYSVGTTAGGTGTGWSTYFKNVGGLSSTNCYIFDEGGSGFIGNITHKFIDLMNNGQSNVTNKDTITDVIFGGGYNDAGKDRTTLVTNIRACVARAKVLFPNATIWVAMLGYSTQASGTNRKNLIGVAHDYAVGCVAEGGKYVNNSELFLPSDPTNFMSTDGIHPKDTGYYIMGNAMYDAITKGGGMASYVNQEESVTCTAVSGITNLDLGAKVSIRGGVKRLKLTVNNPSFSFSSATNIAGNSSVVVCDLGSALYGQDSLHDACFPCRVALQVGMSPATFYGQHAELWIKNKQLVLFFKDIPVSGSTWESVNNVNKLYFIDKCFEFDSRLV